MEPIKIHKPAIVSGTGSVLRKLNRGTYDKAVMAAAFIGLAVGAAVNHMATNDSRDAQALAQWYLSPGQVTDDLEICNIAEADMPFNVVLNNKQEAYVAQSTLLLGYHLYPETIGTVNIDPSIALINTQAVSHYPELKSLAGDMIRHNISAMQTNPNALSTLLNDHLKRTMVEQHAFTEAEFDRQVSCYIFNHELTHAYIIKHDLDNQVAANPWSVIGTRSHVALHEFAADMVALRKGIADLASTAPSDLVFQKRAQGFVDTVTLFRAAMKDDDPHLGAALAVAELRATVDLDSLTRDEAIDQFSHEKLLSRLFNFTDSYKKSFWGSATMDVDAIKDEQLQRFLMGSQRAGEQVTKDAAPIAARLAEAYYERQAKNDEICDLMGVLPGNEVDCTSLSNYNIPEDVVSYTTTMQPS